MAGGELATGQRAALAVLLAGAVEGVVGAQAVLDHDALARVNEFIDTPQGGLALPPLWYSMTDVQLDLELAASITRLDARHGGGVRLDARLLNPTTVSLFGYQASSGLKVSLRLAPRETGGAIPPLPVEPTDPA